MPLGLAEIKNRLRDGRVAVLSGHRQPVPVYTSPQNPCKPDIEPAPAIAATLPPTIETPPHVETELEKTAKAMREIVKGAVSDLGAFPRGRHFDLVYYETSLTFRYGGNRREGVEARRGKVYAVVTRDGEMHIRRASGNPNEYGELDLDSAPSHRATDQEVLDYAEPLMITIKRRIEEHRIKAIVDFRQENTERNSPDTNCLTRDLVNVDAAISQLSLLKIQLLLTTYNQPYKNPI